jgi:hypothetical protein
MRVNEIFYASIGGYKEDKLSIRIWLFFKGKKYQKRRQDILLEKAHRRGERRVRAAYNSTNFYMMSLRR